MYYHYYSIVMLTRVAIRIVGVQSGYFHEHRYQEMASSYVAIVA